MNIKISISIIAAIAIIAIAVVWNFSSFGDGANDGHINKQNETSSSSDGFWSNGSQQRPVGTIPVGNGIVSAEDKEALKDMQLSSGTGNSGDNSSESNTDTSKTDKYKTDPVPPGKPQPQEPQNVTIDQGKAYTCIFSIECGKVLLPENIKKLKSAKFDIVPAGGVIFAERAVTFYEGESVFDILLRETKNNKIHMEFVNTPIYNSAYIEGIANLYEFDCGELSGWIYSVNGWFPNYGSSRYQVQDGDVIEWHFTCDLGRDFELKF